MPGEEPFAFHARDPKDLRRFVGFFVSAGLVNATIAALLLCRLPEAKWLSVSALLVRATLYVLVGAAAGVAGAWFYWRRFSRTYRLSSPLPFGMFSLICAAGWVWVPAAVLLSTQDSEATAIIGILCGAGLGAGLRKAMGPEQEPKKPAAHHEQPELFAATSQRIPLEWHGYLIAGSLYAAAYAQHESETLIAGLLAAAGAFLFAWYWKQPVIGTKRGMRREAAWRLGRSGGLAILLTAWALMLGLAHRNRSGDGAFAADSGDQSGDRKAHNGKHGESSVGPGGFESVILWPFPPKKQIIPPIPEPRNYLGQDRSRPMLIRFDGAYWYFQAPETGPGRTAHQAHGSPLTVNIHSMNSFPLVMEAHQRLIGPVKLSRCGEIDVEIENRDNMPGAIALAVMLGDSTLPNAPTVYLGKREIETSLPSYYVFKAAPVRETLRFAIPTTGPIRKFDDITVMLLPDMEHELIGPKIAIEQFQIFPR